MKILFSWAVISLLIIYSTVSAQEQFFYKKVKDVNGDEMLLGECKPAALKQQPFASWYFQSWQEYKVDSATCNFIRPLLADKKLLLFMGTWCGDSRREVPRMLKMLECCNFPMQNLTLIMVSNEHSVYKQSPTHEEQGRNIVRVPTLIILKDGTETGRIIEFPVISLEKDLLAILSEQPYRPNYSNRTVDGK